MIDSEMIINAIWELEVKPELAMVSKRFNKLKTYNDNLSNLMLEGVINEI